MRVSGCNYIAAVLSELRVQGFSSREPYCLGRIEKRIRKFALSRKIHISGSKLFTNPRALSHMLRRIKKINGISVTERELCAFPISHTSMALYYDKYDNLFIYIDEEKKAKYVIHPNYKIQINRKNKTTIFLLTASRLKSLENFYNDKKRYEKIQKRS
ncbi:MAG: hypothetical protein IKS82_08315 [Bacteroidales bacterium]|nr:hypothetical protein [Bacteroidales bacterium]